MMVKSPPEFALQGYHEASTSIIHSLKDWGTAACLFCRYADEKIWQCSPTKTETIFSHAVWMVIPTTWPKKTHGRSEKSHRPWRYLKICRHIHRTKAVGIHIPEIRPETEKWEKTADFNGIQVSSLWIHYTQWEPTTFVFKGVQPISLALSMAWKGSERIDPSKNNPKIHTNFSDPQWFIGSMDSQMVPTRVWQGPQKTPSWPCQKDSGGTGKHRKVPFFGHCGWF